MRTVPGKTDRVVIVGAGLAGLSAALRLAGAGREVTVLEREHVPGGRAGLLVDGGYSFDTGPTVLTMPDLIADALACVGERLEDWLDPSPSIRCTARTTPTARRWTCGPTSARWPRRSGGSADPTRPRATWTTSPSSRSSTATR